MEMYFLPIIKSFIVFPVIAFFFTLPYIIWQYHKYGSLPFLRSVIVYSFILYLLSAYFLVILPLPDYDTVANLNTPVMQLKPFSFLFDIVNHTSLGEPIADTNDIFSHNFMFFQAFFNILLTIPFGVYLRYYFRCNFKKTFLYTFLLTLFFEVTQLTGLYFIYPRPYRIFDVDDLLLNTIGGILGYFICGMFIKILPSREEIDQKALEQGMKVSIIKRTVAFLFDFTIYFILILIFSIIFTVLFKKINLLIVFLLFIIYYIVIPIFTRGFTIGNLFLNLKIEGEEQTTKPYQIFLRNFILYFVYLASPFYLFLGLISYGTLKNRETIIVMILYLLVFFIKIVIDYVKAILNKPLLYERISKTRIKSTIEQQGN